VNFLLDENNKPSGYEMVFGFGTVQPHVRIEHESLEETFQCAQTELDPLLFLMCCYLTSFDLTIDIHTEIRRERKCMRGSRFV
jgi:hypothetical protein